jgi:hypothetical protein
MIEDKPEIVKLTSWSNEPKVSDLKKDLTEVQSIHSEQVRKIDGYMDLLNVSNTAAVKKIKGRSSITPRLIRKQAEWRYASLSEPFLSTDDLFNIEPVAADDQFAAEQNQLVINNQFNTKINKVKFINDYVRAAVNTGTVICKVGWEYAEEEYEEEEDIYEYIQAASPDDLAELEMVQQLSQGDPHQFEATVPKEWKEALQLTMENQIPVVPSFVRTEMVKKSRVVKNCPTIEVCNYKHVMIDPTAKGDLSKASFVIYKYTTTLSDLKKSNKNYKNLDQLDNINVDYLAAEDIDFNDKKFNFSDKPRQKLVCYEYWGYWDIDGSGITKPIVATFVGDTMILLEENPFPDKSLPFSIAQYLPVFEENYGECDAELLEDNQKIIGAVTRGMVDLMARSANGQIGYAKGILDTLNLKRFKEGDDYAFNPGVNPEQAFHVHKFPEIPQSAYTMLQLQQSEAESLTGVKSFSGGISGQALGNTATGVRSALDATSKRDLEILRRLAEGLKTIGRKIIAMNAVWLSEEETVRITNNRFVQVRRDDLAGNFDLKLAISTAEVDNQKAEELAYMLQTMGNNMDFNITKMLLSDIAKLRKMPLLAKKIEEYNPQPDPIAVEKAKLEVELLRAQINEANAKAQAALSNVGLNEGKTQAEIAKARKHNNEADESLLNYVQEETGTNQERELQKIREQGMVKAQETLLKESAKAKSTKE